MERRRARQTSVSPRADSVVIISAQTDTSCEQGASCPPWLHSVKLVGDVLLVSCHCV